MTLYKALKSGLPFKRAAWTCWITMDDHLTVAFTRADLLASDYQILKEPA